MLKTLLKTTRTEKGLTQRELAQMLNIKYQNYQKWEYGSKLPNLKSLLKLSEILNLSIATLVEATTKQMKD